MGSKSLPSNQIRKLVNFKLGEVHGVELKGTIPIIGDYSGPTDEFIAEVETKLLKLLKERQLSSDILKMIEDGLNGKCSYILISVFVNPHCNYESKRTNGILLLTMAGNFLDDLLDEPDSQELGDLVKEIGGMRLAKVLSRLMRDVFEKKFESVDDIPLIDIIPELKSVFEMVVVGCQLIMEDCHEDDDEERKKLINSCEIALQTAQNDLDMSALMSDKDFPNQMSPELYLMIRKPDTGYLYCLEAVFLSNGIYLSNEIRESPTFKLLVELSELITSYQNDILGFKRDYENNCPTNYVTRTLITNFNGSIDNISVALQLAVDRLEQAYLDLQALFNYIETSVGPNSGKLEKQWRHVVLLNRDGLNGHTYSYFSLRNRRYGKSQFTETLVDF